MIPTSGGPRIGELFSGYGGLGLGVQAATGGTIAWHSDIDPGACKILAHRYPNVPNLGDIAAIDWSQVEPVDVLTGGFPCQDVSSAGKRAGIRAGTRSGLWSEFARAIDALRPRLVVIENVRGFLSADAHHPAHRDVEPCPWCVGDGEERPLRALGAVLGDLADIGFDAEWQGLRAGDVGAPHGRYRVFLTAWPAAGTRDAADDGQRSCSQLGPGSAAVADTNGVGRERGGGEWYGWPGPADGTVTATDAARDGWDEGWPEPAGIVGGPDAALSGDATADPDCDGFGGLEELHGPAGVGRETGGDGHDTDGLAVATGGLDWGAYGPAIRRWQHVLGRVAPPPTERGKTGQPRLSSAFAEWLMGLPDGWVTDVPGLTRNQQLKALGNGVVPQQAAAALRLLLPDVVGVAA